MMLEFAYFTLNNVGPRQLNLQGLIKASLGREAHGISVSGSPLRLDPPLTE